MVFEFLSKLMESQTQKTDNDPKRTGNAAANVYWCFFNATHTDNT